MLSRESQNILDGAALEFPLFIDEGKRPIHRRTQLQRGQRPEAQLLVNADTRDDRDSDPDGNRAFYALRVADLHDRVEPRGIETVLQEIVM